MLQVHEGQCGLCAHFGEHDADQSHRQTLVQIRSSKQAPDNLVEDCGHPKHAELNLVVTPISGCSGFVPAMN
jgi:hypothetical protein